MYTICVAPVQYHCFIGAFSTVLWNNTFVYLILCLYSIKKQTIVLFYAIEKNW